MNFLKNHTRSTSIHLGLFENMVPHICLMRKNHVPQCSPKKYIAMDLAVLPHLKKDKPKSYLVVCIPIHTHRHRHRHAHTQTHTYIPIK